MAERRHHYRTVVNWTAGAGSGTTDYKSYSRNHVISAAGKPDVPASSDPSFRGDAARYNPEELLVAALSSCHMLWYLHLCAIAGIVVTAYRDEAEGEMLDEGMKGGHFTRVVLHPQVTVAAGDMAKARALHHEAHRLCFVASSVNFPVDCEPTIAAG